ncbi:PREDICTED: poly(U)-specific endoribonuclease homolog [Habropoda laboriosa]|uniref:poly(U)-specific endoribonuclease homolog n=1 Tax=Habropoda laboriosa TaxID=597456 RepID=UPI00083D0F4F|nr:PREDICTED: poly(U)-specific endoribonuclease homolog [Habropoda laboriosa]
MKFKIVFLTFILVFFVLDGINAKVKFGNLSFGSLRRSYSRSRGSYGGSRGSYGGSRGSYGGSRGSSHGTSYGSSNHGISSHGTSFNRPVMPSSIGQKPSSTGTSHSHATASSPATSQSNKNINTHFLHGEGGGATRPTQTQPAQSSKLGNHHTPYPAVPASAPPLGGKPGVAFDHRQTSPYQPSAPHQDITKSSAGTLQNQGPGQANPSWSNPYLNTNSPNAGRYPPWSNPHQGAFAPPVSGSQPAVPGSQSLPIGFKDHIYPQNRPTSPGTQFSPPTSGHPPYPTHSMPSSPISGHAPYPPQHMPSPFSGHTPYPTQHMPPPGSLSHSAPSPYHPTNSMPLGNPYSMHPPGGVYNAPGQASYPQQPQMFAQPATQPFIPGQTILMVPEKHDSGRGFGQMVKEALVFSTINAGVNRIINPHTHHYTESRPATDTAAPAAAAPTTHVTYNNQYFNGVPGTPDAANPTNMPQGTGQTNNYSGGTPTSNMPPVTGLTNSYPSGGNGVPSSGNESPYVPNIPNIPSNTDSSSSTGSGHRTSITGSRTNENVAAPTAESNAANPTTADPNVLQYRISDNELYQISEELFMKSSHDISKMIKLNLQTRVTSPNVTDEAREPLFDVEPELLEYPTIYATRSLYNSYEYDYKKKINRTIETRKMENLLIDTFLNTNEIATAMQWLADHGFVDPDDFERKDVLRRIWFTMFSGSTCGFERVFASENYGNAIVGVQDWIYFQNQESQKRIDYMGYVDKLNLGSTASLLKLNFQMDGIIRPNATIFVGTLPELEMSLYTICFYARPNNLCPVSLGGTKFNIYTHSFNYFGSEVMDLGLLMF